MTPQELIEAANASGEQVSDEIRKAARKIVKEDGLSLAENILILGRVYQQTAKQPDKYDLRRALFEVLTDLTGPWHDENDAESGPLDAEGLDVAPPIL